MSNDFEIDMSVPVASEVEQEQEQQQMTLEDVKSYLPHLEPEALLELQDSINTLLKKKWKTSVSGKGSKKAPQPDKPKKPASKALLRTQAWIAYVLAHCTENGWKPFNIRQESKNKVTGEKEVEVTERSGSKPNSSEDDPSFQPYTYKNKETGEIIQPAHVFEDTGKHLTYKDAMTLIAILKWKEGVKPESIKSSKSPSEEEERPHWSDLYVEFMESYEASQASPSDSPDSPDSPVSSASSSSTTSSPKVTRLTAAEKEEERARKRQIAEEEKAEKRRAKEEEKAEKEAQKQREKEEKEAKKQQEKAEKEAQKQREKEEKEAQKQREKAEKEAKKKSPVPTAAVVKKSPLPTATASKASPVSSSSSSKASTSSTPATKPLVPAKTTAAPAPVPTPAPAAPAPSKPAPKQLKKKEEEKKEVMVWNIPEDGLVHDWTFKGVTYLANSEGGVWERDAEGNPGNWVGMVVKEENRIDTTAPEPEYIDEE